MRTTTTKLAYQAILVLLDALVVLGSVVLSYILRLALVEDLPISLVWERLSWVTAVVVGMHLLSLWLIGQYSIDARFGLVRTVLNVIVAILIAYSAVVLLFYLFPYEIIGRVVFTSHMVFSAVGLSATRIILRRAMVDPATGDRILVLGPSSCDDRLFSEIERAQFPNHTVVGRCDVSSMETAGTATGCGRLILRNGDPLEDFDGATFNEIIRRLDIDHVLVMPGSRLPDHVRKEVIDLKYSGLSVSDFTGFYSRLSGKLPLAELDEQWFVHADRTNFFQHQVFTRIKRFIDIAFSVTVLIGSAPILVLAALAIKVNSPGGPVLFRQERYSQNKVPFTLLKFRTMVPNAEAPDQTDHVVEKDPRLFATGNILRKFRIDELPQLVNILRGEMSLVGPRPTRPAFAAKMRDQIPFYDLRFKVKPGLTGLAQISMRPPQTLAENVEKVQYDLYYVQNASLWLDISVILRTVRTVLARMG